MFEDLCSFARVRSVFRFFMYNDSLDVVSNSRWFLKLKVDILYAAFYVMRWCKNS
jgi:hypothetical protein